MCGFVEGVQYALGLDFSTRFFRLAVELQKEGCIRYALRKEASGDMTTAAGVAAFGTEVVRRAADAGLSADVLMRTEFLQADACNLDARYKAFNVVVCANVIEHLYKPLAFLTEIHTRIPAGGLLVLASTYAWDDKITPRDAWLGGSLAADGRSITTLDAITAVLAPHFEAKGSVDLPFVERQTARTFSHGVSQVTVFQKR